MPACAARPLANPASGLGFDLALPTEDQAALAAQAGAIVAELAPATTLGAYFARRVAVAVVRAERAVRAEAKALAHRVRHAPEAFELARLAAIDSAQDRLRSDDPRTARRELLGSAEGIARLDAELRGLRGCLTLPEPLWTEGHGQRLDACLGHGRDPLVPSRVAALTAALRDSPDLLTHADQTTITSAGATEASCAAAARFALGQLLALIDRERAALRADRAGLDPAAQAASRAEAADRAAFDPSPAAPRLPPSARSAKPSPSCEPWSPTLPAPSPS